MIESTRDAANLDLSDADLLRQARGGDRTALETLVVRHLGWLRSLVRRRLGAGLRRDFDSEDLLHEVVAKLLATDELARAQDVDHLFALLQRVVETDAIDLARWHGRECRARARERRLPQDASWTGGAPLTSITRPSQLADRHERMAWIRVACQGMASDDREILKLRVWQSMSFAEVGVALGIAEDAARMRCNRALARLARAVAELRQLPTEKLPRDAETKTS